MGSNFENPPNPTQLHEDFIRKVDAWEAKKAWLEEHKTVDISFIKKMNALSKAVYTLGNKLKKIVSNHAILFPDIDLKRKKVWIGMERVKKEIENSSLYEITSSTVSAIDIEEKAEATEITDSSTMNYDVATIEDKANAKNFEIELCVDSLNTTENSVETPEEEKDKEEKVEDNILKETMKKVSKSTAFNFEIEHAVDSLKENCDVDADLKKVIDEPGYEETKLVKDATPTPTESDDLEGFGTRYENLPKDVDEHIRSGGNSSEAAVDTSNDATFKNVPFPFDPGLNTDAAEENHYNEAEAENEDELDNSSSNDNNEMGDGQEASISIEEKETHIIEVKAEEEKTIDDSESQDVYGESLVFQPDAPSVVVCCYCRNTSPSLVQYLTTRKVKTADQNESDTSAHSDLILSLITEEVEAIDDTVEAERVVDAREVPEDIIEAMVEGTKGEENNDRDKA